MIIELTDKPVRVSSGSDTQELRLAVDALHVDEIDLELHVLSVEGTTPSLTLEILSGMQIETTDGWEQVAEYTAVTAGNTAEILNVKNFVRYIRWNVKTLSGTSPAATFILSGVGRSWS